MGRSGASPVRANSLSGLPGCSRRVNIKVLSKGNATMQPNNSGKSIADRMRDCIAEGLDAKASAEKIARQISMKRTSKRRLMELHAELSRELP
jgi:hypothetical protein